MNFKLWPKPVKRKAKAHIRGGPLADDLTGKSVIIHENPDDYRTQPSGNAGKRLACGLIK